MNIHLKNKEDFESLMGSVYLTVKVGSNLYGCQNQESDTDYLHFYAEHEDDTKSFLWTHHQLQYKTDKEDHNFTTLKSFIRNLLTGDSTINYEVLHSKDLQNNKDLNFLLDYIKEFTWVLQRET
jgi:hypothetical protein